MSEERRDELLIGLALDALDSDADIREAEELVSSDPEAAATLRRYRAAAAELASAGFEVRKVWSDRDQRFALLCAQRA